VSVDEIKTREDLKTQRDLNSPTIGQTRKASTVLEDHSRFDEAIAVAEEAQSINPMERNAFNQKSQSLLSNFEIPQSMHITSALNAQTRPASIERTEAELLDEFLA